MNILFVCSGNTCRSPLAEAIALGMPENAGASIGSAGVSAFDGAPASQHSRGTAKSLGLSLEGHRSRALSQGILNEADLVLAMTESHKSHILQFFENTRGKTFTVNEYAGEPGEMPDPFGMGREAYEQCAEKLARLLKTCAAKWNKNKGGHIWES